MTALSQDGLPPLRDVIARLQLSARKSLSQNFILDLNLTRRIARGGGSLEGVCVVEIGPGPGGLTRALLIEGAKRVIAIEQDERCRPALDDIAAHYPGRLEVIMQDALTIDYAALAGMHSTPLRIIANLPYAIATPLLLTWLKTADWPPWYDGMVLMFQREVAERLAAGPGSKAYGRLSVLTQWRTTPRVLFHVSSQAFTPPPKVSSSVVLLIPKPLPAEANGPCSLERITAAAFGQRRKMLRSSLKPVFADAATTLQAHNISPEARAEDLSVEDFCRLAAISASAGR